MTGLLTPGMEGGPKGSLGPQGASLSPRVWREATAPIGRVEGALETTDCPSSPPLEAQLSSRMPMLSFAAWKVSEVLAVLVISTMHAVWDLCRETNILK